MMRRLSTPVWLFWAHACVLECCALPQRVVCVLVAGQQDALPATCVSGECYGRSGAPLECSPEGRTVASGSLEGHV